MAPDAHPAPDADTRQEDGSKARADAASRIDSLDAIRGIAALIVVFHHTLRVVPDMDDPSEAIWAEILKIWPLRLLWAGDEAVVVFFVLSGFVLALGFLERPPPSWRHFALRRVLRLYPPYLAALAASAIGAALFSAPAIPGLSVFFNDAWHGPVTIRALLESALFLSDSRDLNVVFWSLVVEMRISLVFPFLFWLTMRLGPGIALPGAGAISIAIAWASPDINVGLPGSAVLLSFSKTGFFVFFFVLGIVLAAHRAALVALLAGRLRNMRPALAIIGIGLLGLNGKLPYATAWLGIGLGFAVIVMLIQSAPSAAATLQAPALQRLGRISYSLYLVHIPVLYALVRGLYGSLPLAAILAIAPPAALLAAWIAWKTVEAPSIRLSRSTGR